METKQFVPRKTKIKNWIGKAIKQPGALHAEMKIPEDDKIPAPKLQAAAKKPGKLGRRARLATTLESFTKKSQDV